MISPQQNGKLLSNLEAGLVVILKYVRHEEFSADIASDQNAGYFSFRQTSTACKTVQIFLLLARDSRLSLSL